MYYFKILLLIILAGCGSQQISGVIEIFDRDGVQVRDSASKVGQDLPQGPVIIEQRGRTLALVSSSREITVKLPSRGIRSGPSFDGRHDAFYASFDLDQDFDLRGYQTSKQISSRLEEGTRSCTYTGYCFTCMPGFDGKMDCAFKFSSSCSGSEPVMYRYTDYEMHYQIDLLEPASEVVRARFTSEKRFHTESVVVKTLGSCS